MSKKINSCNAAEQKKSNFTGRKLKNFIRIFCLVAVFGVFALTCLAGCNKSAIIIRNAYDGLIFNGGAAVCVNDGTNNLLYFGNAYVSDTSFGDDGAYQSAAANAFLARVNLDNLSKANAGSSVAPTDQNHCPRVVDNMAGEVVSHSKGFTFVIGQDIYYCIPNRKKVNADGSTDYNYTYTTIMKNRSIIFERTEEMKQMEVLQAEGQHFFVFLVGTDLVSINLTRGGTTTLATDVVDVALPKTQQKDCVGSTADFNGKIYYITNNDQSKKVVKEVTLATGEKGEGEVYFPEGSSATMDFVARIGDTIFFTESTTTDGQTYMADVSGAGFGGKTELALSSLDSVFALSSSSTTQSGLTGTTPFGYVLVSGSTAYYISTNGTGANGTATSGSGTNGTGKTKLNLLGTLSQALFTSGRTFYYATSDGIYSADLSTPSSPVCKQIVSGLSITSGASYGFDGKYLYFYASLASIEGEDSAATGKFMYRADVTSDADAAKNWQLVSYVPSRISKDEE